MSRLNVSESKALVEKSLKDPKNLGAKEALNLQEALWVLAEEFLKSGHEVNANALSPAETERLAMLLEEAGEVIQIGGKILRHGYASKHPDSLNGPDNRQMLENELADLYAVSGNMEDAKDVRVDGDDVRQAVKKKARYTHHQGQQT